MGPDEAGPSDGAGAGPDPFWQTPFSGRTYMEVIRSIVRELGALRTEFPQMAGFDAERAEREIVRAPRKLIAYAHDVALAPLDPAASPDTHAGRLLVHRPVSDSGVLITIEFHTPEEGRFRRSMSEQRMSPSYIGETFLEINVVAANAVLERRVRDILRREGLEFRDG